MDYKNIAIILANKQIKQKYGISKMGIFGSFAQNKATENSDIDFLVYFNKNIGMFEFSRLKLELHDILKREIDLVTEPALKPLIKNQILDEVKWV